MGKGSNQNSWFSKKFEVVVFSSTAIALYGYDQGMMSLVNTNKSYLSAMQLEEESTIVGVIVSVYYLGCAVGAVIASWFSDKEGRKPSIFACLATTVLGNLIMFVSGLKGFGKEDESSWGGWAIWCMLLGRVVLGLGVGGIDAVIPVYSSELSEDGGRGKALAQEFQMNIFGLLLAYSINLGLTVTLGKDNQWAWRLPILAMQIFPLLLMSFIARLPESPRWALSQDEEDKAKEALDEIYGEEDGKDKFEALKKTNDEEDDKNIAYKDMILPSGEQYHPTIVTVMGQVNQALTGYGAVSVYGSQIFELLGFATRKAEYLTLGNYVSYFCFMTIAWLIIDVYGRRKLLIWGSVGLTASFVILTVFGGLAEEFPTIPDLVAEIPGTITLFFATAVFGIGWLSPIWLIPTEIYPSSARAQGSAISVIIWGLANFAVTLLTPIGFNNLKYWLFAVFAVTNAFAGWWTWRYCPESGGRSFEENQEFFSSAEAEGSWVVRKVDGGKFAGMPEEGDEEEGDDGDDRQNERSRLLRRRS